jgi:membrane protein DedA with SNARE-associated domain
MAAHLNLWISHYGLWAVFVLMSIESLCIPVPSEVIMSFAGYLVYAHTMGFWPAVIAGTLGNLVGGWVAYLVGFRGGRPLILRYGRYILLNREHLARAERWFAQRGELSVLIGRLLPGVRTFISLPAGIGRMAIGRFLVFSAIGSLIWNIALTALGFQLGKHWETVDTYMKPLTFLGAAVLVAGVVWFWFGRRRKPTTPDAARKQRDA